MYAVICIVTAEESNSDKDHYELASRSKRFTIEEARHYKDTIAKSRKPLIVDESRIEEAIELNNRQL